MADNHPTTLAPGTKVGHLTLLRSEPRNKRHTWWLCRCDCGTEKWIVSYSISRCVSCGCVNRALRQSGFRKTHGMRRTPEYGVWCKTIARCENPKNDKFRFYGGRGIRVCDEWRNSFEAFYRHMGKRPTAKHSIDRIDTNGNYEPGNCRWATYREQMANRRNTVRVQFEGELVPLSEAARRLGISYKLAHKWHTLGKLPEVA